MVNDCFIDIKVKRFLIALNFELRYTYETSDGVLSDNNNNDNKEVRCVGV